MTDQYEQAVTATYVLNVLRGVPKRSSLAHAVTHWIRNEGRDFIPDMDDESISDEKIVKNIDTVISGLEVFVRKRRNVRPGVLQHNITLLQGILGLDDTEAMLLALAVRIRFSVPLIRLLCNINHTSPGDSFELAALMLCCPKSALEHRIHRDGKLCRSGIIDSRISHRGRDLDDILNLSPSLVAGVLQPVKKKGNLHSSLVGKPVKASLLWDDFSHLGEARDFIERLVRNAVRRRLKGINILFYGPPGTGKTEFCKTLADRAGIPLYLVAEEGGNGVEAERGERLRSLRLANSLLENEGKALLLFDEMEDLLCGMNASGRQPGSKVFLNRLLEGNSLPTFWTTNNIASFDKALLRRMTLALEVKTPPRQIRRKVWERILQQEKMRLPQAEIDTLVRDFDDAPAIAGNAVKAARLAGGGTQQVRFAIGNARKVMRGGSTEPKKEIAANNFDSAFVNADTGLAALTERLVRPDAPLNFSLCLYGPPGTGKTAYTRYLADCMGIEVMQMRASDLVSKWVGETERLIAAAFQKAREDEMFLIFDEADSLLHDRQHSRQSWEVSQVNEMLTWMESHPLPFACTTNLMERLDSASLRRFTFKIGFEYLAKEQIAACFRHFFKRAAPPGLEALDRLTPGDFAVVQRKAGILGQDRDSIALLSMLRQEQDSKPGRSNPIGFGAAID